MPLAGHIHLRGLKFYRAKARDGAPMLHIVSETWDQAAQVAGDVLGDNLEGVALMGSADVIVRNELVKGADK